MYDVVKYVAGNWHIVAINVTDLDAAKRLTQHQIFDTRIVKK